MCAEIEQLRAQLQITRDKNGVYVDPVQFANMESRIESQESMLLECEAALKSRNEELKLIKSEINVVEEKLGYYDNHFFFTSLLLLILILLL